MSLVIQLCLTRCISKFESSFDSLNTTLKPIKPPVNPDQTFLNRGHARFQILQITRHSFGPLVDLAQ
jgi:hypothetical protein